MSQDYSQNEAEQMAQTIAELQGKLKQASKNTTDYMEAGMRAGFIFGVSKGKGAIVESNPTAACELMAIERDELRSQAQKLQERNAKLDAENGALILAGRRNPTKEIQRERALADSLAAALKSIREWIYDDEALLLIDAVLAQHAAARTTATAPLK